MLCTRTSAPRSKQTLCATPRPLFTNGGGGQHQDTFATCLLICRHLLLLPGVAVMPQMTLLILMLRKNSHCAWLQTSLTDTYEKAKRLMPIPSLDVVVKVGNLALFGGEPERWGSLKSDIIQSYILQMHDSWHRNDYDHNYPACSPLCARSRY